MAVPPHCADNDEEKGLHMLSAGAVFLRLIFQPWLPREPWGMWVSLRSEFHSQGRCSHSNPELSTPLSQRSILPLGLLGVCGVGERLESCQGNLGLYS